MKKRGTAGLSVGGSSILMIFVLLCLTTFATLSVVSANADLTLTGRAVESAERYYEADAQGELMLQRIDSLIRTSARSADPLEEIAEAVRTGIDGVEVTPSGNGLQLSYAVPMSDIQELRVTLTAELQMGDIALQRTGWSVCNIGEWDIGGIDLWDGEWDSGIPLAEPPIAEDHE